MSVCLIIGILYLHLCLVKTETKVLYWENDNKANIVYSIQNNKNSSEKEFPRSETFQKVVYYPLINEIEGNDISKTKSLKSTTHGIISIYNWLKYLLSGFTNLIRTEENHTGSCEK